MLNFGASKPRFEGGPGPPGPPRIRAWVIFITQTNNDRFWLIYVVFTKCGLVIKPNFRLWVWGQSRAPVFNLTTQKLTNLRNPVVPVPLVQRHAADNIFTRINLFPIIHDNLEWMLRALLSTWLSPRTDTDSIPTQFSLCTQQSLS